MGGMKQLDIAAEELAGTLLQECFGVPDGSDVYRIVRDDIKDHILTWLDHTFMSVPSADILTTDEVKDSMNREREYLLGQEP